MIAALLLVGACGSSGTRTTGPEIPPPVAPTPAPPLSSGTLPEEPEEAAAPAAASAVDGSNTPAAQDSSEDAPSFVLGTIAGSELTAADLLTEWHTVSSQEVFLVLEKIVATRLTLAEAERLGIRLEPEVVEERLALERARLMEEVAREEADLTLEEYVVARLGVRPGVYLERLRRATIRQMLAERVVRAWTLGDDWIRARMIVTAGPEEMAEVRTALEAGGDFAELAREKSRDELSREHGGLVPFLVRQEGSALSTLAFEAEAGELAGPLTIGGREVLLRIEEKHAGRPGPWRTVGPEVEASLGEFPVRDNEFLHWKLVMEERYPIDLSPMVELLGIAVE